MTQTLIKAGPGSQMMSGIKPSVDPLSSPLWIDGENIIFRKLGIEKAPGWVNLAAIGEPIYELDQALVEDNQRAYLGAAKRVYSWEAGAGLRALNSFASLGNIRLETWGTWLLMTNGVDPLRLLKGDEVDNIAGIPFNFAKIIYRNNVHMLAANTSNGSTTIEWCAASDIEDWVPVRANSAGNYVLRDLESEVKAIVDLGKNFAIYSSETMMIGGWVGQPNIFSFQPGLNGVGAVGGRSVVNVGAKHIGLSRQGVFETDGTAFQFLDEPDVQQWLQDTVNWDLSERIVGWHDKLLEQVVFHFPNVSGTYSGIPYSYRHKVFGGRLTSQITAAAERSVFSTALGAVGNNLVGLGTGRNANTAALPAYIQSKPMDAGEASLRKIFDYLRLTGRWTGGKVKIGAMENPNDLDSIVWFYDEALAFEHFFDRDTPYVVLKFYTSLVDEYFAISQFLMGGEPTAIEA